MGCASGVGLLPAALGPIQLQLKLVQLVLKLGQVCYERAYDRQNYFRQVMADRHNNNKINKISGHSVGNDQTTFTHNYSNNDNHFYGREQT